MVDKKARKALSLPGLGRSGTRMGYLTLDTERLTPGL
jgi:hypothetical protein